LEAFCDRMRGTSTADAQTVLATYGSGLNKIYAIRAVHRTTSAFRALVIVVVPVIEHRFVHFLTADEPFETEHSPVTSNECPAAPRSVPEFLLRLAYVWHL
jgi:hypothetical protein